MLQFLRDAWILQQMSMLVTLADVENMFTAKM